MRAVFFGTPEFAVPSLEALARCHEVLAVVTMPDRPSGRKLKLSESPVKVLAKSLGISVFEPAKLRKNAVFFGELSALDADVFVVAAYGQVLPKNILDMPKHGCINVHASLLPRHRGASPIHAALLNGDEITGVTIMQMDEGLDTGDMLLRESISILPDDDFQSLHDRLANLGADCLLKALEQIEDGSACRTPQDGSASTYASMLAKTDGRIDWTEPTERVLNRIRAFSAWPGTYAMLEGKPLKIVSARGAGESAQCMKPEAAPGDVLVASQRDGLIVKTGDGAVELLELVPSGGKKMLARDFLRGRPGFEMRIS